MSMKPTIPKGTRDYHPEIVLKRNYITDIIRDVFTKYGYLEIQTPSFEKRETLSGKYGNEGDRLIFNILNSGEKVRKADIKALNENKITEFINSISEKALRYDLTVPLARYVSQHQNEIKFPFRRFQIQNVRRADRPQKGRYQEFTQCDADVIGSDSKYLEYEMIQMYSTNAIVECVLHFLNRAEHHTFTFHAFSHDRGVIQTQNHILRGHDNRSSIGWRQHVIGGHH